MELNKHIAALIAQDYFSVTWPLKRLDDDEL